MLFVSAFYTGNFYSFLTKPDYEKPIDTLNDLSEVAAAGTHKIFTVENASFLHYLIHAEPTNKRFYPIGKNINK